MPTKREVAHALQLQIGRMIISADVDRIQDRFWVKVKKPPHEFSFGTATCWVWIGATNSWGYGNFRIGRHVLRANRVAYLLSRGTIPDGMIVLHTCDNRRCCNPAHLRLGTQSENVREEWDRYRKPARALGLLVTRTRRNGHV